MQPSFKPPKTEEEFKQRAGEITVDAAHNMVNILQKQREKLTAPLNAEIAFYKKVIEHKQKATT